MCCDDDEVMMLAEKRATVARAIVGTTTTVRARMGVARRDDMRSVLNMIFCILYFLLVSFLFKGEVFYILYFISVRWRFDDFMTGNIN